MDKKNFIVCNEGYEKKGGIGKKPNVPRPNPPKGQDTTSADNFKDEYKNYLVRRIEKLIKGINEIEECIECCSTFRHDCLNCRKGDECNGALSDLILKKIKELREEEE